MAIKTAEKKDQIMCCMSIGIMVVCYAVERLLEIATKLDRTTSIILAMIFTVALAAIYFVLSKTTNSFFGLLAGLIGYKLMPPSINALSAFSVDASMLYYIIQKAGIVIFVLLIIKMYKMQQDADKIRLIPILAAMVIIPFCGGIGNSIGTYLTYQFGNMLYLYFSQFAAYIIGSLVILAAACKSNYTTLRFISYFEFVALGINILRKLAVAVVLLAQGEHVSKSVYVWIVIFVAVIAMFVIAKNKRKKIELNA